MLPQQQGGGVQPQLARVIAEFETAESRLERLLAALPPERWSTRSDPNRWSVAECIAHLNLTGRAFVPLVSSALEAARALGIPAARRYRRDLMGWLLSTTTGPLPRIGRTRLGRVKTAAAFVPSADQPQAEVVAEFRRLQAEQIGLTRGAEGLAVDRVRVTSPFDSRVRYNAYSALVILPRHQHRHLQQAELVWPA